MSTPERPTRQSRPPLPVRLVNRVGRALTSVGLGRLALDPDRLKRAARRRTGRADFGDGRFDEGLARLTESIDRDANLYYAGRLLARAFLERRLRTRLLAGESFRRFPQVADARLTKPMLVCGFGRTGTTLLYNLLALDPTARAPQLWEVHFPAPPPATLSPAQAARHIAFIQRRYGGLFNRPDLRRIHALPSARAFEECYPLLEPTFLSPSFELYFHVPDYAEWLFAQPVAAMVPTYRYYARLVNLLMVGHEGKRWLGKSPFHVLFLPAMAEVFPDLQIVRTHRDPSESIPSLCSLLATLARFYSDRPRDAIRESVLRFYEIGAQRFEEVKKLARPPDVFDVAYESLIADPIGAVAAVYEHFALPLTAEHESAMRSWLNKENPYDPRRHGPHLYSARDFGLDETMLKRLGR